PFAIAKHHVSFGFAEGPRARQAAEVVTLLLAAWNSPKMPANGFVSVDGIGESREFRLLGRALRTAHERVRSCNKERVHTVGDCCGCPHGHAVLAEGIQLLMRSVDLRFHRCATFIHGTRSATPWRVYFCVSHNRAPSFTPVPAIFLDIWC